MNQGPVDTPALIIIFNRPDKVRRVVAALEAAKPTRLYVAADGPRPNHPEDIQKCAEARRIATHTSWPCEVRTLFSDTNLGVDPAVERGISWFFTHEEAGIILEDDCLPHPDFFAFATELLERYQKDEEVMMISGNNFQDGQSRGDGSYYFSRYPNTWGWATWRRAWRRYDSQMKQLPHFIESRKAAWIRPFAREQRYWLRYFQSLYTGRRTAWDAKWLFAIWNTGGVCITPNVNLVSNIGFGSDATHTKSEGHLSQKTHGLDRPIVHPSNRQVVAAADTYLFRRIYFVPLWKRFWYRIKSI